MKRWKTKKSWRRRAARAFPKLVGAAAAAAPMLGQTAPANAELIEYTAQIEVYYLIQRSQHILRGHDIPQRYGRNGQLDSG